MRLTIERIRTLVLAAGVLLIVVLASILIFDKWKRPFNRHDIPKRLGIDIQQEANGVTYTQAHGGHTIFKIHASRVVQLRNEHATLHDVRIELYGQNGKTVDRIQGDQFDYDQKTGIATAAGPVEITLMRPGTAASAAKAKPKTKEPPADEIHVRTSGLVFNQQTGIASTDQRVQFSSLQGNGSAMGASYNSDQGVLVLDHAVELTTNRGPNPVELHAQHAEFNRNTQVGHLRGATADTRGEHATAAEAQIAFREDGSVERMDVSEGFTASTDSGSRLAAPRGTMQFNEKNQPLNSRFEGGVTMNSASDGRQMSGTAPEMTLAFVANGELRHAHLENGVEMQSQEPGQTMLNGRAVPVEIARTWRSPVADVEFRQDRRQNGRASHAGQVEPSELHGTGGVVLTSEARRSGEPAIPSRLSADEVTGWFGPNSTLRAMTGIGHASIEEITANGARQTATGDRLRAEFASAATEAGPRSSAAPPAQIQSAEFEGNVSLVQQPAVKTGAKPGGPAEAPLRATAGRAVYETAGQWLHLTLNPRIEDAGMELTAGKVDVSQQSGDAFARGNVKATWIEPAAGATDSKAGGNTVGLGGKGPVHAIATEAQLHQPTGEATFRGHARLWQQDNSITAPLIVIDRQKQTLVAKTQNPAEPVVAVLLNAGPETAGANRPAGHGPSVIRVRGGELWYSGGERKTLVRSSPLAAVTAQSDGVESSSTQVELFLGAPGAGRQSASSGAPAQVERMDATGHVVLTSQNRRGTGEKLAYSSQNGEYVLTGTPSTPPRFTDPQRGSVTGAALIFNSRDDSVSIEGGGHETTTETTAPK